MLYWLFYEDLLPVFGPARTGATIEEARPGDAVRIAGKGHTTRAVPADLGYGGPQR